MSEITYPEQSNDLGVIPSHAPTLRRSSGASSSWEPGPKPDTSNILNQMPVISPDGTPGVIPHEDWTNAEVKGFKRALFATSPDGKLGILHPDDWPEAQRQGFQTGQPLPVTEAPLTDPRLNESRLGMLNRTVAQPFAEDVKTLEEGSLWDKTKLAAERITNPFSNPAVRAIGNLVTEGGQKISDLIGSEWEHIPEDTTLGEFGHKYLVPGAQAASTDILAPMAQPEGIATMGALKAARLPGMAGRLIRMGAGAKFGVPAAVAGVKGGVEAAQAAGEGNTEEAVRRGTGALFNTALAAETLGGAARETPALGRDVAARTPNWIATRAFPESLMTPQQQVALDVRTTQNQASNLAAAMESGGTAPKSTRAYEEVALPLVDDFRAEAAKQGVTEKDFSGRKGYETAQKVSAGVREGYDNAYKSLVDPIRSENASTTAQTAATRAVGKLVDDASLLDQIQRGDPNARNVATLRNIAETIGQARTVGELDALRIKLNQLGSKYYAKNEAGQYQSTFAQQALDGAAQEIRNALYEDMAQRYGGVSSPAEVQNGETINPAASRGITEEQIRELQKKHGAAIQADQLMKDTGVALSRASSEAKAPPTYWQRLRGGAAPLEVAGRPKMAATKLLQSIGLRPPDPTEIFNTRMRRVISKASPEGGTEFPVPPITPEYVEPTSQGPTSSRIPPLGLPAAPPTIEPQFTPPRRGLPPSQRIYGRPETPIVDRAEQNREYGSTVTPLGPTGKAGVMVRPFFLKGEVAPPSAPEASPGRGIIGLLRPTGPEEAAPKIPPKAPTKTVATPEVTAGKVGIGLEDIPDSEFQDAIAADKRISERVGGKPNARAAVLGKLRDLGFDLDNPAALKNAGELAEKIANRLSPAPAKVAEPVIPPKSPTRPEIAAQKATDEVQTIAGKMNLDEFEKKGYTPDQVTQQDWVNLQRAARRKLGQREESGPKAAPFSDYEEYHRQAVKEAVMKGEDVDPQVLSDYPDLEKFLPPEKRSANVEKSPEVVPVTAEGVKPVSQAQTGTREASPVPGIPREDYLNQAIADGETRLRSGVNSLGEKLSPEELKIIQRSVDNAKAELFAITEGTGATTRRERLENKVEKRQEWAEGRSAKAASLIKQNEPYRGDIAFNTQPGHIPERARAIRRTEKAGEHISMAQHHEQKAAGLQDQLEHSIYSDDANAIESLEKRIAEHEAERAEMVQVNSLYRKGDVEGLKALGIDYGKLKAELAKKGAYWGKVPHLPYEIQNLGGRIQADKKRLESIRAQQSRRYKAATSESGVTIEGGDKWVTLTFSEKPERSVLEALRSASFRWSGGSWVGERGKLPAEVQEMLPKQEPKPAESKAVAAAVELTPEQRNKIFVTNGMATTLRDEFVRPETQKAKDDYTLAARRQIPSKRKFYGDRYTELYREDVAAAIKRVQAESEKSQPVAAAQTEGKQEFVEPAKTDNLYGVGKSILANSMTIGSKESPLFWTERGMDVYYGDGFWWMNNPDIAKGSGFEGWHRVTDPKTNNQIEYAFKNGEFQNERPKAQTEGKAVEVRNREQSERLNAAEQARSDAAKAEGRAERIVWRGKTMTRAEAIAKEPDMEDAILTARTAESYLPAKAVASGVVKTETPPPVPETKAEQVFAGDLKKRVEKLKDRRDALQKDTAIRATFQDHAKQAAYDDTRSKQIKELSKVEDELSEIRKAHKWELARGLRPPDSAKLPDAKKNKHSFYREYFTQSLQPVLDAWKQHLGPKFANAAKNGAKNTGMPDSFPEDQIFVNIPGDGKFLVNNDPKVLTSVIKGAVRGFAGKRTDVAAESNKPPKAWKMSAPTETAKWSYLERMADEAASGETQAEKDAALETIENIQGFTPLKTLPKMGARVEYKGQQFIVTAGYDKDKTVGLIPADSDVGKDTLKWLEAGQPKLSVEEGRKMRERSKDVEEEGSIYLLKPIEEAKPKEISSRIPPKAPFWLQKNNSKSRPFWAGKNTEINA